MTTSPNEPAGAPPQGVPPEPPRNAYVRAVIVFVKVIAWAVVALVVSIGLLFGTCAMLP